MRVENQTSDPVEYEQNGGDPNDPEAGNAVASQAGEVAAHSGTNPFTPVGTPPWEVHFQSIGIKPQKSAKSPEILNPDATVTLNSDWTVSVS